MGAVLSLKNVDKKIGKAQIIQDVSFDVYPGEIFGFLGPNGAGKTTTIRMIVGLTKMTAGDITVNGHSIATDYKRAIEQIGTIVENPELYPYLTAEKNLIHFGRMSKNVTKKDINDRLKLVNLDYAKDQKVKTFSLGMKQRLGIAQAMLHRPKLLILDEPTNGLDPAGIREIRTFLRKVAKEENVAILISSHLLSEIEHICDRFAIIQEGNITQIESVSNESDLKQGVHSYYIETDNPTRAQKLIETTFPNLTITQQEQFIQLMLTKEEAGNIVTLLTSNDVVVYQVVLEKQSLEERFFEATSGGLV
ncbi:ABC transporter [Gracilibacillus halophilus YIM-C55.5]|uniref:ABC transporter n=1 Tax=Gracilibacillus halophilus YIM-C55.5 TaxID=1308866 RepID=N4WI44_9BACI|nr:ABC transporter ATP-binding protein [Gracilibacillus halophilus]ENH95847.1 ABC transporter [Gracilibacillus halophilus YIM-C55.5]